MTTTTVNDAQIRETAYLFWLDDGQPEGRDEEHWLRAVDALTKPVAKTRKTTKPRVAKAATKTATKTAAKPAAKRAAKPKVKATK